MDENNSKKTMIKYELEFPVRSSISILYNAISTPSGLTNWFCNDVNIKDKIYTFNWDYSEQEGELIKKKMNESIRFKWLDVEDKDAYFEMRIQKDEITNDVSLMIVDFAEDEEDLEESKLLWASQVGNLMQGIGS
ncbi:MAG: hypothetical protein ACI8ZO_000608 [Flavobacteriales bacterium]|jgi:uncharacterized protein YndB with AHSA1/START domain